MEYEAVKKELISLGFTETGNHHPEGISLTMDKDGVILHACISYPFIETWSHEGYSGLRHWYKSIDDIKNIVNQIISNEKNNSHYARRG